MIRVSAVRGRESWFCIAGTWRMGEHRSPRGNIEIQQGMAGEEMALTTISLPYGMRQVRITPYTTDAATELAASSVPLPNSRTLEFEEEEEFQELRGDDAVQATHGSGPKVNWTLEAGGYPVEAVKAMYGGTIIESGVTPNQVKIHRKHKDNTRPYFLIRGRAISDSGGDFHIVIYRAKATGNLSGAMNDGEFWLTGAQGVGLPSLVPATDGYVWDTVQNETATAVA